MDSAEEMRRKRAGIRAAFQKRFEQELEEKHEIMLIVFMKMYKKVQKGLTTLVFQSFQAWLICPSTK